ncbi:acyl-CoA dehydrogenase family protein [Bacillus benzoevorans]|uniref:Alkylation response protein AidB-like acyl-CoA dehydrogenase n=1 Tax=Bacillus benzoevorans TaxID=1456 RepID=A0A7X0HRG5_9BACI|nr:acyl-CoA dehydrogenase family protein [Bacillus benzoevorans]MBB6444260.1 alkylation response protein AidB-like acyl-CoA dehydrogenase [Bacillus benzoevorans]
MSQQNQITLEQAKCAQPIFTEAVKVDSTELEQLLSAIANDAENRRKNDSGAHPFYAVELIKKSKLGALRLPVELGGAGANIRELFHTVIRLAEADPDAAHSLRSHFGQVEEYLRSPDKGLRGRWLQRVAKGDLIGNAVTEISSNNVGNLVYETTLSPDGEGYRLNGTKYFSTGTMFSDWIYVTASTPEGKPVSAVVPVNRDGIVIEDDWDGIGQRLTGSGTTHFDHVYVHKDEVTFTDSSKTPFNSYLQLILHAVVAGILRNVVTDAKDLVQSRKRTFSFAASDKPANDPQLLQIIGELSAIAFAAESIVLNAAEALDTAANSAVDGKIDFALSHEASLKAAQTKVVVDQLALRASSLLFEVGGASATRQSAHFDRHWRNIRTIASHNPTVYKARAIGNYIVNGTELPIGEVYF